MDKDTCKLYKLKIKYSEKYNIVITEVSKLFVEISELEHYSIGSSVDNLIYTILNRFSLNNSNNGVRIEFNDKIRFKRIKILANKRDVIERIEKIINGYNIVDIFNINHSDHCRICRDIKLLVSKSPNKHITIVIFEINQSGYYNIHYYDTIKDCTKDTLLNIVAKKNGFDIIEYEC